MGSGGRGSRALGCLFTLLLLTSSAVPVLAAEGAESSSPPELSGKEVPTPEEAARLPSGADISKALGEHEEEEAERERWLASPEAAEQRKRSRFAFADLVAEESEELLRSVFGQQLESLNSDPSRYLSDAQLVRTLGDSGAVVRREGDTTLLESPVPVRTADDDGQAAKVDLSLEAVTGAYRTRNALSDLRLPSSASGPIRVGGEGFEISQVGATDSEARRFGDKNLFYPSLLPDTDLLVSPTSFGVELFNLVRSANSPESLRFAIDVPEAADLRSDGRGGAEVVRGGEILTRIPKPWAVDAQQADVPIELEVGEGSIMVRIPHRGGDYAYPILLDPIVEDWVNTGNNWYGGDNWDALSNGAWKWTSNNSNIEGDICCWEGSHAGLLTIVRDAFYGPEQFGQWSYSTPNEHVFIPHIWLTPFNRADMGCGSYQPHDYAGLWNPGDWWEPIKINHAKDYGNLSTSGTGQSLIVGLGSGPEGVWLACDRILYLGGVGVWLDDAYGPVIHSIEGMPAGWFSDETQVSLAVKTGDEGLGIDYVKLTSEGKGVVGEDDAGCTGLYGSRCPNERTSQLNFTGDSFGEGIRSGSVVAADPTGKTAESQFQTKVDRSAPQVDLGGQLAVMTEEDEGEGQDPEKWDELSLPVYNLKVEATDGDAGSDLTKSSGVESIEIFLDGGEEAEQTSQQECPLSSCPMTETFELALHDLSAGKHILEVVVTDQVGKARTRSIEFEYFPATGMKDEYVMHYFALPGGQGGEEGEAGPELAVNVMNGNLVYRERDVDVEGFAVDLEVERFYNSQLPEEESTQWGDGWTLAQTPELEPEEAAGPPSEAELLDTSGALDEEVELPTEMEGKAFDPELQATIAKEPGGYELTDETGESATSVAFDEDGRTEEHRTEGAAKVDYRYEGAELTEIAVDDPASAGNPTEAPEEAEQPEGTAATPVYSSTFGSYGTGNGQLNRPADLALDAEGDLWVVDKSNDRVQQFSAEGEFISTFGSYGAGDGQFNRPASIAIDASGYLWVTDADNHRVQKFAPSGKYLAQFGSYGTGDGQFRGPEGIAIDNEGNLWVSDTYNGRVQKFGPEGQFLQVVGSYGSGEGQIGEATGIDIGPNGNVWIADWQNNRVSVFDSQGEFLDSFGSQGSGDGQFNRPDAIDVDGEGNVWVGDQNNDRIQRFDLAGQYVDQFGTTGSGEGQFDFTWPMGLHVGDGYVWASDTLNHRIQKWAIPGEQTHFSTYSSAFGSYGPGEGQLDTPGDVALDGNGDLWVADKGNDRVQRFGPQGEFLSKLGSSGSGDGQLAAPTSLAIDAAGHIWVADRENHRIQQFDAGGGYLSQFGVAGLEDGQLAFPEAVAIDAGGDIWVSDGAFGTFRLQKFDSNGAFLERVATQGSEPGQLGRPRGIDIDPQGRVWVADSANDRVAVFEESGEHLRQLGSQGSGPGQLDSPTGVDVDAFGNVWVGDQNNDRIQHFDVSGEYVGQLGAPGPGQGEFDFSWPIGIASDDEGNVWVSDGLNHRVQRWVAFGYTPEPEQPAPDDDPRVDVAVTGGLVDSVAGEEAGQHGYAHEGDDLVSHDGPEGKTEYEYDPEGRMTKVTLPNGTWAQIAYNQTYGRVASVTVDPAGEEPAKTTYFEFSDVPRRTTVIPPDAPHVVYYIGADGSVLKSWSSEPPELDLAGTLYDNREEDGAIWAGDHWLEAEAASLEGIASIEVIANGTDLVDEKYCEQTPETGLECTDPIISEWVTATGLHAPGHLTLEVIATDRSGEIASERFWVDIPEHPPPPAPGTPVPPTFAEIAEFREEFGLEEVFPVESETELNERIFNLIVAWHNPQTPEGEVARASAERWGVPLRPADVAELEYRLAYQEDAAQKIPPWGEEESRGESYAGFYTDESTGGLVMVGDTGDQEAAVADLTQSESLMAPERVTTFTAAPDTSLAALETQELEIEDVAEGPEGFELTTISTDVIGNNIEVGTTEVATASSTLASHFGTGGDYEVAEVATTSPDEDYPGAQENPKRDRIRGQVFAGDRIHNPEREPGMFCTAGYGLWEWAGRNRLTRRPLIRYFLLTAGHCFHPTQEAFRRKRLGGKRAKVGIASYRHGREYTKEENKDKYDTDAVAIRLNGRDLTPRWIVNEKGPEIQVKRVIRPWVGMIACNSGARTKKHECGKVERLSVRSPNRKHPFNKYYVVSFNADIEGGDSGSPVFQEGTGNAVGIIQEGWMDPDDPNQERLPPAYFTPLAKPLKNGGPRVPGILGNSDFVRRRPLHLATKDNMCRLSGRC